MELLESAGLALTGAGFEAVNGVEIVAGAGVEAVILFGAEILAGAGFEAADGVEIVAGAGVEVVILVGAGIVTGAELEAVIGAEIMAGAVLPVAICVGAGSFVAGAGVVADGAWGGNEVGRRLVKTVGCLGLGRNCRYLC